jgi:serine/threonine protein kinase
VTGRRLSHYRIERRLGAGGMGEVWLAEDLALGRPAALKLLPQGFDPELRRRLLREAEASGRLQHPAIATPSARWTCARWPASLWIKATGRWPRPRPARRCCISRGASTRWGAVSGSAVR